MPIPFLRFVHRWRKRDQGVSPLVCIPSVISIANSLFYRPPSTHRITTPKFGRGEGGGVTFLPALQILASQQLLMWYIYILRYISRFYFLLREALLSFSLTTKFGRTITWIICISHGIGLLHVISVYHGSVQVGRQLVHLFPRPCGDRMKEKNITQRISWVFFSDYLKLCLFVQRMFLWYLIFRKNMPTKNN